jgi:hypothetical protein
MKAKLTRTYQGSNTLGQLDVWSNPNEQGEQTIVETLYTLELPWLDNKRGESCIPVGTYKLKRHTSPKFGKCFWLQDVPNRSEILIHPANYTRQLRGCIAVGLDHADIDKDGELDTTSSRKAMQELLKYNLTEIEIVEI